jgi:hypothetical protein
VLGLVDSLNGSSNVELLDRVVEVVDGRVSQIVGTENLLRLLDLVGLVDGRDYPVRSFVSEFRNRVKVKLEKDEPVKMARGASSRASRRVTRVPAASLRVSICSWETSRVIGIGKRDPSTRRRVETTLRFSHFESALFPSLITE